MNNNQSKQILRNEILEKRLSLTKEQVHTRSRDIELCLINHLLWKEIETIGLYAPVKNEVDTTMLLMHALEMGMSVYFPRVEQGLEFYEVSGLDDLQKGAWSIPEPKHDCIKLGADKKLDLLIVPGVVFDHFGYRLGYGKGFYDNILSKVAMKTMALAYDFQIVPSLPIEPWDQAVSNLITESGEFPLKKKA